MNGETFKIQFDKPSLMARFLIRLLMIGLVFTALVSCTNNTSREPDLNDRYRSLIHAEFQKKAYRYHADSRYLLLVDYSIPSNQNRFFIWDMQSDQIVEKFWCAHGLGGNSTASQPEFSNEMGSNCSSLGWFLVDRAVGVSAHYGYKYHAVDGLDASNSNARRRQLLIHPWFSVTRDYEAHIKHPMTLDYRCAGCFTTTEQGYQTIDRYIKSCSQPLLLYAIN